MVMLLVDGRPALFWETLDSLQECWISLALEEQGPRLQEAWEADYDCCQGISLKLSSRPTVDGINPASPEVYCNTMFPRVFVCF